MFWTLTDAGGIRLAGIPVSDQLPGDLALVAAEGGFKTAIGLGDQSVDG
ncbi:hypothetical protein ACVOMV_36730 [Mesorhizobium atlanticum]